MDFRHVLGSPWITLQREIFQVPARCLGAGEVRLGLQRSLIQYQSLGLRGKKLGPFASWISWKVTRTFDGTTNQSETKPGKSIGKSYGILANNPWYVHGLV